MFLPSIFLLVSFSLLSCLVSSKPTETSYEISDGMASAKPSVNTATNSVSDTPIPTSSSTVTSTTTITSTVVTASSETITKILISTTSGAGQSDIWIPPTESESKSSTSTCTDKLQTHPLTFLTSTKTRTHHSKSHHSPTPCTNYSPLPTTTTSSRPNDSASRLKRFTCTNRLLKRLLARDGDDCTDPDPKPSSSPEPSSWHQGQGPCIAPSFGTGYTKQTSRTLMSTSPDFKTMAETVTDYASMIADQYTTSGLSVGVTSTSQAPVQTFSAVPQDEAKDGKKPACGNGMQPCPPS